MFDITHAVAESLLDAGDFELDHLMEVMAKRFVDWSKSESNNRAPGNTCMEGCRNLDNGVYWRDVGVAGTGEELKIGLLTDIHEAVEFAEKAIRRLRKFHVDEIICLGDFCETGKRLDATCELLMAEGIRSVWGNHDFGLCEDARNGVAIEYSQVVVDFAKTVQPKIQLGDILFSHVEPWLNAEAFADLWYFDGIPDTAVKQSRIFANQGWSIAFGGHYHRWLSLDAAKGIMPWSGNEPLELSPGRFFVVINACMGGHFALFDTESRWLTPLEC